MRNRRQSRRPLWPLLLSSAGSDKSSIPKRRERTTPSHRSSPPSPTIETILLSFRGLIIETKNGHDGWVNFLCGKNLGDYSLDQRIADEIGQKSRFPSLQLAVSGVENEGGGIGGRTSFTKQKIPLPMMRRPSVLYSQLFVSESDKERAEYITPFLPSPIPSTAPSSAPPHKQIPSSSAKSSAECRTVFRSDSHRQNQPAGGGSGLKRLQSIRIHFGF